MNTMAKREGRAAAPKEPLEKRDRGYITPHVDIVETGEGYVLEAELPGVGKNGLEVTLEGNELTIIGRRQPTEIKGQLVYRESTDSDYRRVFVLDPTIDAAKIQARMENGVLHLNLPKAERVRPRKITVSE